MKAPRSTKSNRGQSDYFELLITQYICHLSGVTFSYSDDLSEVVRILLERPDGSERLKLQNSGFETIKPHVEQIIDTEVKRKGKVVEVIWVGRQLLVKTTSDVDAKHESFKLTRFSVKSIKGGGTGTLKNIGMRTIRSRLGVDFSGPYETMWEELKEHSNSRSLTKSQLKNKVNAEPGLLVWAQENGKKYQVRLNTLCQNAFNRLPTADKVAFVNHISDSEDEDLYVIIVNAAGVTIYKPTDKQHKSIKTIEAVGYSDEGVGYIIHINGVQAYRVQTNNTNGIGIGPFCQRIFLV